MATGSHNSLARASSAYLRSAMHQPIQWREFGEEAFAAARAANKPMLLDIGAVWCHWCHVMDRESYDDPDVAAIVNEHYIAVKVDRDERPDIDSRYQAAVAALTVLRGNLLPSGGRLWEAQFQACAAFDCSGLSREAWRGAGASKDGGERDRSGGIFFGGERGGISDGG
jgi:hypothetical protein